jgi:kynurenine formamidase
MSRLAELTRRCLLVASLASLTGCAVDVQPGGTAGEDSAPGAVAYVPPPVTPESHDLTLADFERLMQELSNWGRWGADDELGAANLVTPAKRLEAIALAREGTTVSLARTLITEAAPDASDPFDHTMLIVPGPTPAEPPLIGVALDRYSVSYHGYAHSHLDALCHFLYRGQMYNGVAQEAIAEDGCTRASIDNLADGIVTRGVLIDIPRLKGVPYLEPGTPIYLEDLDAWEEMAGVTVRPGDAVFIRTGRWARRAEQGPWDVRSQSAGLHASTAPWIRARDVAFMGSDAALDVAPSQIPGMGSPVHLLTLVAMGIHLFDNQDLEALAEAAAARNRWEFMFVAAPLPVEGGTGSPLNALAIF